MFDPQERAIFKYFNGTRWVWADPLELSRRLDAALGDPDAVFRDLKKPDSDSPVDATVWRRALECLIANVREVFGMPRIDPETGQGATEEECNAALHAMWDFLAKKKPSTGTTPSSSPSTASPQPASISTTLPRSA